MFTHVSHSQDNSSSEDLSSSSMPPLSSQDRASQDRASQDRAPASLEDVKEHLKTRVSSSGILHLDKLNTSYQYASQEEVSSFCMKTGELVLTKGGAAGIELRVIGFDKHASKEALIERGSVTIAPSYAEILEVKILTNGNFLVVEAAPHSPGTHMPPYAKFKTRIRLFEADGQGSYEENRSFDSTTYGASVYVSDDDRSVYIKGKRLAQMWQGWRGYDGSAVVEERFLNQPLYKGHTLQDYSYKMAEGDPSFHRPMIESPRRDFLLSARKGGLDFFPLGSSRKKMSFDARALDKVLPEDACIQSLSMSNRGDSLLLAYSDQSGSSVPLKILSVPIAQTGLKVSMGTPVEVAVSKDALDVLGYTPSGNIVYSSAGVTRVLGGPDYIRELGRVSVQARALDSSGRLHCTSDTTIISYTLP